MKTLLIVLLFLNAFLSEGQKYASIGEKEGEKYYIHVVVQNNSLYNISKTYDITIEELKGTNPGLSSGLELGQTLWIPVRYYDQVHIVQRRETLYGISKRYSKPIDSIVYHNPEIKDGLKKGQEIIIKNIIRPIQIETSVENPFGAHSGIEDAQTFTEDSLIEYLVHAGETLYSISRRFMVSMDTLIQRNKLLQNSLSEGQVLIIPLKKELEIQDRNTNDTISFPQELVDLNKVNNGDKKRISVFLPFNLDTIDVKRIRSYATEYYMGALLAIDSLKQHDLNCEIHFIDYESKIHPFDSVLVSQEFSTSDLIFAPFNFEKAKKLKTWAADKSVKVIFPLKSHNKLYDSRNNDFFMDPNEAALNYSLAKHLSGLDSIQLVFIKTKDSLDALKQDRFLDIYYNLNSPSKLNEASPSNYTFFANKKSVKTMYVLLSEDPAMIKELLVFANEKENVMVYGKAEWLKKCKYVSSIENTSPFRYAVGKYLNYNCEAVKTVHRNYRRKFNSDLTKMSAIGFDATLNMVLYSLYNIPLPHGLVHEFQFDYEGTRLNNNVGGFILQFDNLNISIVD